MPRAFTHKEHYYGLRCVTLDTIAVFDVLFRPVSHRQSGSSGGTHSALLRSALLPSPASSLPRELVSGRYLPLPEAVGWPRPPVRLYVLGGRLTVFVAVTLLNIIDRPLAH